MSLLSELIAAAGERLDIPAGIAHVRISGLTADSRRVTPGSLFFALKGEKTDGTAFLAQAKQAGALAVLCDASAAIGDPGIPLIRAVNARKAMAHMAAAFYGRQPDHIAAVTGTDGKTSTAEFFRQFWHGMGKGAASAGTLGIRVGAGEALHEASYTTPYPVQLHMNLAELAGERHIDYLCMEASSHGLYQYRLDGVRLEAAAFTNLTRDHLDYHKTVEAYFAAKLRLFSELLPEGKTAVLNQDDPKFPELRAVCAGRGHRLIGFGRSGGEFRLLALAPKPHGQSAQVELFGEKRTLDVPLVGAFQVMNILAALGLVAGTGGDLNEALTVIPRLKGVPGRLEQAVRLANGATVFIDYAHTPAALANILATLRPHTQARLRVVFGCGGDRDAGKRPEMGAAASRLADDVIVTDDNPRSEDPALIRAAVMAAAAGAKEVADRREAIYVALKRLEPGDIVVIAGKGHEKTQIIGDRALPFDDAELARQAARDLKLAS